MYLVIKLTVIKKKVFSTLKDVFGNLILIPLLNGTFLNDYFFFFFKDIKGGLTLGKKTFIIFSLNSFFLSNISSIGNKVWLSKSNGTFCLKKNCILDFKLFILIMPSKKKKYFYWFNECFIGRNANVSSKYLVLGSYKNNFLLKKKQTVRGVAMNPVDHPHGGRTKTNKPEVSPWGWIAKKSH